LIAVMRATEDARRLAQAAAEGAQGARGGRPVIFLTHLRAKLLAVLKVGLQ